jgi:hypothetical protein
VRLTGLPEEMAQDFRCMTALAKYTKLSPEKRMELITNMAK